MNSDFQEISETLHLAKLYIENLNTLKKEICTVENQVLSTYNQTEENIKQKFLNLKNYLCKVVENREKKLLKKAEMIKIEGLKPLKQCEKIIQTTIENTKFLIEEGSQISQKDQQEIIRFLEKASILGNLPEVPEAKEVPCISFYHEPTVESEIETLCSSFGEVFRTAPIQITRIRSRPGAMLIEWQHSYENNEDRCTDIQEFKLQRAFGDVSKEKKLSVNFIDCYTGTDTQYLLRDIQISQPYSFRVCCKFEGTTEWSPWSMSQVGSTELSCFSWKNCDGVVLSNENKIVTLSSEVRKLVFSEGPQVSLTDSVEFTILETDPKSELILALCTQETKNGQHLEDITDCCFMVDSRGKISVAGVEKSTVLSSFHRGLKVCFSMDPINTNKVRVNVDSKDKRVTYDWTIGESIRLFFACEMKTSKWKIMVE